MQRTFFSRFAMLALFPLGLAACHDGGGSSSVLPVDESIVGLRVTRGSQSDYLLRWEMPPGESNPSSFRVIVLSEPYVGGSLERFVETEVAGSARRVPVQLPVDTGVYYLAIQPVRIESAVAEISRFLAVDTADRLAFQTDDTGVEEVWLSGSSDGDDVPTAAQVIAPGRIVGWTPGSRKLAVRTAADENALVAADVPDMFTYATDPVTLPAGKVEGLEIASNGLVGYRAARGEVSGFMIRLLGFDLPVHVPGFDVADFLWSPAGDTVVFLQRVPVGLGYEAIVAQTQRISRTRAHRRLAADEYVRNLRWSPSGRYLALTISRLSRPETGGLYVHDVERRTTYYVGPTYGDIVEWSPPVLPVAGDGVEVETLAFTTRNNGTPTKTANQYVGALRWPLDPTRSMAAQLVYPLEVRQRVDQLVWTSDGTEVLFIHTEAGERRLSRYGLSGGPFEVELGAGARPVSLTASVDGRVACIVDRLEEQEVMVWRAGSLAKWFSSDRVYRVAWSPYGGRLAVLAGDAQARLYRVDEVGSRDVSAGIGPFHRVVDFRWSDRAVRTRDRVTLDLGR